jgi:hypothetical protein
MSKMNKVFVAFVIVGSCVACAPADKPKFSDADVKRRCGSVPAGLINVPRKIGFCVVGPPGFPTRAGKETMSFSVNEFGLNTSTSEDGTTEFFEEMPCDKQMLLFGKLRAIDASISMINVSSTCAVGQPAGVGGDSVVDAT